MPDELLHSQKKNEHQFVSNQIKLWSCYCGFRRVNEIFLYCLVIMWPVIYYVSNHKINLIANGVLMRSLVATFAITAVLYFSARPKPLLASSLKTATLNEVLLLTANANEDIRTAAIVELFTRSEEHEHCTMPQIRQLLQVVLNWGWVVSTSQDVNSKNLVQAIASNPDGTAITGEEYLMKVVKLTPMITPVQDIASIIHFLTRARHKFVRLHQTRVADAIALSMEQLLVRVNSLEPSDVLLRAASTNHTASTHLLRASNRDDCAAETLLRAINDNNHKSADTDVEFIHSSRNNQS